MARNRKEKEPSKIKLKQPDKSGPDPTQKTLLDLAEERGLLKDQDNAENTKGEEPLVGRLAEAILWSASLTMLHFMLDVLVAHQYAIAIIWPKLITRTFQAFPSLLMFPSNKNNANNIPVILLLFYSLHPHAEPSAILPTLPKSIQHILHQVLFFVSSIAAGSYLIYITNTFGYYAIMKQSPPLGCLWIWSVIELDLAWACASLLACVGYLKYGGYNFL